MDRRPTAVAHTEIIMDETDSGSHRLRHDPGGINVRIRPSWSEQAQGVRGRQGGRQAVHSYHTCDHGSTVGGSIGTAQQELRRECMIFLNYIKYLVY